MEFALHSADKIHEHDVAPPAPDLDADRVGPLRVERHRNRRLADPSALGLLPDKQPVGLQPADDRRYGRRREAGEAGDVGLGKRPMMPDQGQHQALVINPNAGLPGSPPELRRTRMVRTIDVIVHVRSRRWYRRDESNSLCVICQ